MSDKEPITEPSMNERIIYEVIVVGLGPAGIAAFSKLAEKNLKVLGLEASNRTGGRICSIKFGDAKIDMGAEWCHGENDNVIYEMIKDLNVVESSGSYDVLQTTYCDSKGEQLPNDLALLIAQLCTETMDSAKAIIKEEQSLGEILIQVFGDLLKKPQYENIPKDRASQALEWLHKYENSIDCSESWFETSKTTLEEYWHCEGDPLLHWKGNGFSTILDVMMKTYPNPHNPEDFEILINKEVINILYENEDMKDIVKVLCTDGTIYYGKHLIITVSLGVLKDRHNALFNPPLPEDKVNCIDNIMFGTVDKVYLQFESRWWTTEYSWVGFLWNEEDFKDIPQEDQWLINVFGFHSNLTQPNLMCLWVTGSNAIYMEKLSNDIVKEKLLALLGRFFGKNCNIPPVLDIARSQWYSDPFFRGSYSCRSVDSDKANVSSEKLGEPILGVNQKPFLCFAGEATSPHYYSTVHGAVMSGHREAQRIIDYVSLKKYVSKY